MRDPIETVAHALARKAKSWDESITIAVDDIAYYLAIEINFWGFLFVSLTLSLYFGTLPEAIIAILTLLISRYFTGGAHAPTLTACFVFSIFAITICASINLPIILLQCINIINLTLIIWYNKRGTEMSEHGRINVAVLVCANALLLSPVVGSVVLMQLLTIQGGENI